MTRYAAPGEAGSVVSFKPRYDHFIGGEYVKPTRGQYFENPTPVTGQNFTEVARGTAEDVELALDAACAAAPAWDGPPSPSGRTSCSRSPTASRRTPGGYYMQPTVFEGDNSMRVFQEEIFGPVVAVTGFDGYDDAVKTANDTLYGLGAAVWSRDGNVAYRAARDIQAGRVWVNNYHAYPAHAAFGGYKQSGFGRENHKMMLNHYQNTKNVLTSYSQNAQGFF